MRDRSLRRASALCSHLWQEQEAYIPHVNLSSMPGLAFIKYMVTREILYATVCCVSIWSSGRVALHRHTAQQGSL